MTTKEWQRSVRYAHVASLKTVPEWPVQACCYLVGGETSRGKTTTCRAISALFEKSKLPFKHVELDEPGSTVNTPARQLFGDSAGVAAFTEDFLGKAKSPGRRGFTQGQLVAFAFSRYIDLFEEYAASAKGGALVLDSIWRFIAFAASVVDVPSPPKGVHPAYASAIERLDSIAVANKCAIFASQNTTLFPIPNLDGASGGVVKPYGDAPVITANDRNDREFREYAITDDVWQSVINMRKDAK